MFDWLGFSVGPDGVKANAVCKSKCLDDKCGHSIAFVCHKPDYMTACIMCKGPITFTWTVTEKMEEISC